MGIAYVGRYSPEEERKSKTVIIQEHLEKNSLRDILFRVTVSINRACRRQEVEAMYYSE